MTGGVVRRVLGTAGVLLGTLGGVGLAGAPGRSAAGGTTYHVAPGGSDSAPGTAARPWATLHRAAESAAAGDTVLVHGGVYRITRPVRPRHSGRPGAPVVFRADPADTAGPAVIDASAFVAAEPGGRGLQHYGAFHVEGVRHVRVEHLGVRGARTVGFMVRGDSTGTTHDVDLVGCRTDQTYGSGVGVWYARRVRVLGCEVVGANNIALRPPGTPRPSEAPHEAISVAGARDFEVARNHVHHGWKEGIDVKETSARGTVHHNHVHTMERQGLYVDSWFGVLEDVEFHSNLVHDSEWGIAVAAEGRGSALRDVRVHHNVFHGNRGSGVFFAVWGADGPRSGVRVTHNTVYRNGRAGHWAGSTGGIDLRSRNVRDVLVADNVAFGNYAFDVATFDSTAGGRLLAERGVRVAGNLSGALRSVREPGLFGPVYGTLGERPVVGDPRFVRPPVDLRLRADSPAASPTADAAAPRGALGVAPPE